MSDGQPNTADSPSCCRAAHLVSLLAATLCAICAAFIAWYAIPRQYTCIAQIHVNPSVPFLMYKVEGKGPLENYDSFCQTQMELLRTRRVIDAAMHSDKRSEEHTSELQSRLG